MTLLERDRENYDKGAADTTEIIIKELYTDGMPIERIAKVTKMSVEEVDEILAADDIKVQE